MNDISTGHNAFRLAGTAAHLDSGAGSAKLHIYTGADPTSPGGAATGVLLCSFTLPKPCGAVVSGALVLELPPNATVLATGAASWGRFENANGDWHADYAVGNEASAAPIKMVSTQLYAGGLAVLTSAVFT